MRKRLSDFDVENDVQRSGSAAQTSCFVFLFVGVTLLLSFAALLLPFAIAHWRREQVPLLDPQSPPTVSDFQRLLAEVVAENELDSQSTASALRLSSGSCAALRHRLSDVEYIESGWTKAIFRATFGSRLVALKVPDYTSIDSRRCLADVSTRSGLPIDHPVTFNACYRRSLKKIVKELLLLDVLAHDNVVKVLHFCADDNLVVSTANSPLAAGHKRIDLLRNAPLIVVTEFGSQLELIKLLQLRWEDRLRLAQNVAQLLVHLASNEQGISALISDFRSSQFVRAADGALRLTDLDDVSTSEPTCAADIDCHRPVSPDHRDNALLNSSVLCVNGRCKGHNERRNLGYAANEFDNLFLPHGAPSSMREPIARLLEAMKAGEVDSADRLLDELNDVVSQWGSGAYLDRESKPDPLVSYASSHNTSAGSDYRCRYAMADNGCVVSVFDAREAAELCDADAPCSGFALLPQRNWSGRRIAVLRTKIDLANASHAPDTVLFSRKLL